MTLKDDFLQIRILESNIKDLKHVLLREEERLAKLQEECGHKIVIIIKVISIGCSLKAKCLFCSQNEVNPNY